MLCGTGYPIMPEQKHWIRLRRWRWHNRCKKKKKVCFEENDFNVWLELFNRLDFTHKYIISLISICNNTPLLLLICNHMVGRVSECVLYSAIVLHCTRSPPLTVLVMSCVILDCSVCTCRIRLANWLTDWLILCVLARWSSLWWDEVTCLWRRVAY